MRAQRSHRSGDRAAPPAPGAWWLRALLAGCIAAASLLSLAGAAAADHCIPAQFRIAIDVGHHTESPGTLSARGRTEFSFNVDLATRLAATLKDLGFRDPLMIGLSGETISLKERVALANAQGVAAFISIHHDSVNERYIKTWQHAGRELGYTDKYSGFSIFYSQENPQWRLSKALGAYVGYEFLHAGMAPTLHHAEPIEGENRELVDAAKGLYRWDGLAVVRATTMPAVLIEAGVIKNRNEEVRLASPRYQQKVARAIAGAVATFCSVVTEPD